MRTSPHAAVASTTLILVLLTALGAAQSIRDRIRLSPEKRTPITEQQANELTLTLNDASIRPIQVWVRPPVDRQSPAKHRRHALRGAQVRSDSGFARFPESRSSMFQARVTNVVSRGRRRSSRPAVEPAHAGSARCVLEIVTEPIEALSVPNEAIIESDGKRVVYVQVEKGRYEPREVEPGLQGELYTEIRGGLKAGEQVVTFGSFFIDADHKLKGF
jgi:hypothetical protein